MIFDYCSDYYVILITTHVYYVILINICLLCDFDYYSQYSDDYRNHSRHLWHMIIHSEELSGIRQLQYTFTTWIIFTLDLFTLPKVFLVGNCDQWFLEMHVWRCCLIFSCSNKYALGCLTSASTAAKATVNNPQSTEPTCCWHCLNLHKINHYINHCMSM